MSNALDHARLAALMVQDLRGVLECNVLDGAWSFDGHPADIRKVTLAWLLGRAFGHVRELELCIGNGRVFDEDAMRIYTIDAVIARLLDAQQFESALRVAMFGDPHGHVEVLATVRRLLR